MSNASQPETNVHRTSHWGRTSLRLVVAALATYPLLACSVDASDEESLGISQEAAKLPFAEVIMPIEQRPTFPWQKPDPEELVEITAGNAHTCVRKRNGNVYCWGRDDLGQAGRSPNATCTSTPDNCVDRPSRVYDYGGLAAATQIDAGDNHTCALDSAGKAYCWGSMSDGQVGAGYTGSVSEPLPVSGGLTFTSISAGTSDSCGTTADGLFCWGFPLPSGPQFQPSWLTPVRVYSATGLAPTGVSVGFGHVCAQWVSGSYRETNCWGRNWEGQTGSTPSPFTLLGQGPFGVPSDALRVTTQGTFTCVDRPGPSVLCFGAGKDGQLGNGMAVNSFTPQQVGGATLLGFPPMALSGVSTGQFHACALDPAGAAYCWGNGNYGQLGNGLSARGAGISSSMPAAVVGGLTFKAIAAGQRHTCAIGTDNRIYCWGSNYHGELGTQYKVNNEGYTTGWVASPVLARAPRD